APAPAPVVEAPAPAPAPQMQQPQAPQFPQDAYQQAPPMNQGQPPMYGQPPMMGQEQYMQQMYQNQYNPQGMMPNMQNPYYGMMGQQPMYNAPMQQDPSVTIKNADFPDFGKKVGMPQNPYSGNLNLLMGVQLEISVVIGKARKKIKDIMDFGQGTVIELDKQTGAPAEIIVNGQLLAYGDVIVVGDNFGVRVTEIVGAKELLDSLGNSL
ncbi:MAG: flagellar motor switch protein FliN, partial [Clostridia bacterium]|nr:flagellar motor switch protein FliN [Clostridia bacterium]